MLQTNDIEMFQSLKEQGFLGTASGLQILSANTSQSLKEQGFLGTLLLMSSITNDAMSQSLKEQGFLGTPKAEFQTLEDAVSIP